MHSKCQFILIYKNIFLELAMAAEAQTALNRHVKSRVKVDNIALLYSKKKTMDNIAHLYSQKKLWIILHIYIEKKTEG